MPEIAELVAWSEPKEVRTKNGPRLLLKALPTPEFWSAWKDDKDGLKAEGVSLSKTKDTQEWEVCWWKQIPREMQEARAEARAESRATKADVEIPAPQGQEYLPFQKAGISFASERPSVLIADEMGLGKTIQAIGLINMDREINRILVICPASLKLNWKRELEKWLTRPLEVTIATKDYYPSGMGVTIVNYDIVKKMRVQLRSVPWDMMIVDEAHYCKNRKAQRTMEILGGKNTDGIPAHRKIFMTGTPIVNRPVELLPILEAIGGDVMDRVGGGWKYLHRYCDATQTKWGWDMSGASNLPELQAILRETCMVRRLKKDVLTELPPKRRQIIEIEANGASKAVAAECAALARHEEEAERLAVAAEVAKAGTREEYEAAVAALTEHQQAVFTEIARLRHETALAKVPAVIDHLDAAVGDGDTKVVLFAHHHDVIAQIARHFGGAAVVLTGETKMEDRQAAVDRFQEDPTCTVFVGSITAAGVGITLTAASHVIFGELDWVPGNMSQAEDRCHRIGQAESVLVQHLVLDGSIDARLAKVLVEKQAILDAALDDMERAEIAATPVPFAARPATGTTTQARIARESAKITPEDADLIHRALRILSGMCDGARTWDGHGFSKIDAAIGRSLAEAPGLTAKQAALGLRIAMRYRKTQLAEMREEIERVNKEVSAK